jgi:hypothetical protein
MRRKEPSRGSGGVAMSWPDLRRCRNGGEPTSRVESRRVGAKDGTLAAGERDGRLRARLWLPILTMSKTPSTGARSRARAVLVGPCGDWRGPGPALSSNDSRRCSSNPPLLALLRVRVCTVVYIIFLPCPRPACCLLTQLLLRRLHQYPPRRPTTSTTSTTIPHASRPGRGVVDDALR